MADHGMTKFAFGTARKVMRIARLLAYGPCRVVPMVHGAPKLCPQVVSIAIWLQGEVTAFLQPSSEAHSGQHCI